MSDALNITADFLLTGACNTFNVHKDFADLADEKITAINEIIESCIKLSKN